MYHLIFVVKIKNNMRVCIVGSGLSALSLAKALVNQKIFVDMIESKKLNNPNFTRTIGISQSNVDFFNRNIINIDKIAFKINKIEIFSENLNKENLINFENKKNSLFSIIKNYELIKLVQKDLFKNKYFKIRKLKNDLNLKEDYNLVINTDYFSKITLKYFNKKIVKKYNSSAYVTLIKHEKLKNKTAIQIFTKNGPLAFLPISAEETSIVFSNHGSSNINYKDINNLIKSHNMKYEIKSIKKAVSFGLESLNLRSYYNKNILAFGDLIHKVHPLAGQGFNMTIRDIKTLLEIINTKLSLGLPLNSFVFKEFEKKSRHKNFLFSSGIDLVQEFFTIERKTKNKFLSKSVQLIGKNRSLNKIFTKIADEGLFL